MVEDFLNKKNSTRNLSEDSFKKILPTLAEELSNVDYHYFYTDKELLKDWDKLKNFETEETFTASTVRVGMKLCEYFFPNFFKIKNNKGESFNDFWNKENLQKVLKWNRSSHSTPYLSELRRGVYFCNGLTKNTMYRPHIAKIICDFYKPKKVLDPCSGWGGRLLGVASGNIEYVGFETNKETYNNLLKLIHYLNLENLITMYNNGSENMNFQEEFDLVITSPPYFDLEVYSNEETQSENMFPSYEEWVNGWLTLVIEKSLKALKKDGVSCWNTHNIGNYKLIDDVKNIHDKNGFHLDKEFGLVSSSRQANQNNTKNKKTVDLTMCFIKD